jgi:AraC family transcriptional regulator
MPSAQLPITVPVPGFVLRLGVHPAGSALPRHTHDDPTICYVLQGGFTEYSGGEAGTCGVSTLKVMPAGEPHSNRFGARETRGLRVDVARERFADVPTIHRALDERHRVRGGRAGAVAHRLAREMLATDAAGPVAVEALALELVVELARAEDRPARRPPPRWLLDAEEVVRTRYRTRLTVGDVAREVDVHPATLSRGYRRRVGLTIGEHIRRLRVEHAARELRATTDPLSTIALRAGFYDQSHFTNVFHRLLGVTPLAWRAGA